jgi:hypothetical protein
MQKFWEIKDNNYLDFHKSGPRTRTKLNLLSPAWKLDSRGVKYLV